MSRLTAIAIRRASRAPMQELDAVRITRESGLTGDFRGKPGKRQVTVLSAQAWREACEQLGRQLPWTSRRANLLVSGINFSASDVGRILKIGDVHLQIMRETDPCKRMDETCRGLRSALNPDWRGGVCCTVIHPGDICVGDAVVISD